MAKAATLKRAMRAAKQFGNDYPAARGEVDKLKEWPQWYVRDHKQYRGKP